MQVFVTNKSAKNMKRLSHSIKKFCNFSIIYKFAGLLSYDTSYRIKPKYNQNSIHNMNYWQRGNKALFFWNLVNTRKHLQNYEFISIYLIYFCCPRYKTTPPIQDISMLYIFFEFWVCVATFLLVFLHWMT